MNNTDRPDPRPRSHARKPDGFVCINCRAHVGAASFGTKNRNHCPRCLWSRHVDDSIGDRRSACRAPMEPIAVAVRTGASHSAEWCLVHRCTMCAQLRLNRIAGDDAERSLLALALRPVAHPAFPLDLFEHGPSLP